MDYGRLAERLFTMNDDVWMRHANPASGWTRVAAGLLLFPTLWSFHWIGLWALVPTAVIAFWLWINPRFFAVPARRDAWMSQGVFGERVWLNRKNVPIPADHARLAHVTSAISLAGLAVSVAGLVIGDLPAGVLGWSLMMVGKLWFLDRMVWLYADMRGEDPDYSSWSVPENGR